MLSLQGARSAVISLKLSLQRPLRPQVPDVIEPRPLVNGPINLYEPFGNMSEPIIRNLKHGWKITADNATSTSWLYRDPRPKVLPSTATLPFINPFSSHGLSVVRQPEWYRHFHIGSRSTQIESHVNRAKLLVGTSTSQWTPKEIAHLIYAFIGRASVAMDSNDDDDSIATFMALVLWNFGRLDKGLRDDVAGLFSKVLVECFLACWDPNCAWSIARKPEEVAVYAPPAINLSKFIGDCLRHQLVSVPDARACLRVLMSHVTHIEHLDAIYFLVVHSGDVFWASYPNRNETIDEFVSALETDMKHIRGEASWIRSKRSLKAYDKNGVFEGIEDACRVCKTDKERVPESVHKMSTKISPLVV